jgi:uncharacterized coiled-coil protein SlyX
MTDKDNQIASLEARIIELEIRSAEQIHDLQRAHAFVEGYEQRISRLEKSLAEIRDMAENPSDAMPAPSEDLPPHY